MSVILWSDIQIHIFFTLQENKFRAAKFPRKVRRQSTTKIEHQISLVISLVAPSYYLITFTSKNKKNHSHYS